MDLYLGSRDGQVGGPQALGQVSEAAMLLQGTHANFEPLWEPALDAGLQHVLQLHGALLIPFCSNANVRTVF